MSDTTSDKDRGQDTAQISEERLALKLDDFDSPVTETTVTG